MYIRNLVFEGGGVKGIAHIGALKKLEEKGLLNNVTGYAGTSIGGILACILSTGMKIEDLEQEILDTDLVKIKESNWFFTKIYNLVNKGGLYEMVNLKKWLISMLQKNNFNPDVTLAQHFQRTQKELVLCTTRLNRRDTLYMHHATTPDISLIDAMCMTACFPGYFTYYKYKSDTFVDGGVCVNYPFWIFNDIPKLYSGDFNKINKLTMNEETFGLKILAPQETNTTELYTGDVKIKSVTDTFLEIINTMFTQMEREEISSPQISNTIGIHTGNISALAFNISTLHKRFLILYGETAVEKFIRDRDGIVEFV